MLNESLDALACVGIGYAVATLHWSISWWLSFAFARVNARNARDVVLAEWAGHRDTPPQERD